MSFSPINLVHVYLDFGDHPIKVGGLGLRGNRIYFEYDQAFLQTEFNISPLYLPNKPGVQSFTNELFSGLPGVFNDSLPDGWGRLLLDRSLRAQGSNPDALSPVDRLAHVGQQGMGALTYQPDYSNNALKKVGAINLDKLSTVAHEILAGNPEVVFTELLALNGSSAGARPKALIAVKADKSSIVHGLNDLPKGYTHWLVKFANIEEGKDSGAIEYVYSQMAAIAGVYTVETYLFPSKQSAGYFAIKRFDREGKKRLHMATACGLLHSDFRSPTLDYQDLLKVTSILTKDAREVEKMFSLAVFNVMARNRDDHSKNFSFLMDARGEWKLAPAYDLTFSSGPRGEQSTMVMGEGRNPSKDHLIKLGQNAGIESARIRSILEQVQSALTEWATLAKRSGVTRSRINEIDKARMRL